MYGSRGARSTLVTRVVAVLALAWLLGSPAAGATAAALTPADNCAYASIGKGGDAIARAGDGVVCRAGPVK
ncbi:hypothetical protein, partial [Streptomyces sp. NPDC000188]